MPERIIERFRTDQIFLVLVLLLVSLLARPVYAQESDDVVVAETVETEVADSEVVEVETAEIDSASVDVVLDDEEKEKKVRKECPGGYCVCAPSELHFAAPKLRRDENGVYPLSLEADSVESEGEDLVRLTGDAEVSQGRQKIVADTLDYYRSSNRVLASGNVELVSEEGHYLASESVDVHAPTQIGTLINTDFKMAQSITSDGEIDTVKLNSRGSAKIVNLEGEGIINMKHAKYTNCQEGSNAVMISASSLQLDNNSGVGRARNAVVRFMGLPIFYTPYISFPLNDERKTGFLTPVFGSDEESGDIFGIPWYWNIAANQDATITPKYYTDRGLQIGAEYRRETVTSETYIYGEILPDDDLFGDDRDLLTVQHYQEFTDNLTGSVNYNDVSDIDYFDDFRDNPTYFSASYVPRDASLSYSSEYFSLRARANEYQVIDPIISEANAPYERIPALSLSTNLPDGPFGLEFDVGASYTDFRSDFRVEGKRTSFDSSVELPLENIWGYFTPKVSLHHSSYDLNNVAVGAEDSPSFTVPIFSIDTGIYFEKNINWFGRGALQTLEPRLFYAYAPDEDQSDVPIFDTSEVRLNNFSNIYRENRFFGADRVGDTNQVTFGLTSQVIDNESGDRILKASIGQIYFIDDLEQTLSGVPIESGLGDLLAEIKVESEDVWASRLFLQWDHDESQIETASFSFGYKPKDNPRKEFTLGYYYSDRGNNNNIDQLSLEFSWPLTSRFQIFGDERYSLEDSESLYTTLGIEYNGCCWKVRLTGTERVNNRDLEDKKTAVFLELELTTLGRVRTGL